MTAHRPLFEEDGTIASAGRLVDEPLGACGALSSRLARRGAARLGRIRLVLAAPPLRAALGRAGTVLSPLVSTLASLPSETRERMLRGPDVRGFLSEAETWLEIRRLASKALAARGRSAPILARLFDRVSSTDHLATLVPRGRLDAGFPARCLRFAHRRLDAALADLAAFLLGLRLVHPLPGVLEVELRFREDPEQGRPADRIDLGTITGPAGPLGIVYRATGRTRPPKRVRAVLRGTTLMLGASGAGTVIIPAAGSRLLSPELVAAADRSGPGFPPGSLLRLARREMVPGTSIVLAPVVDSRPRLMRVTRGRAGLGRRLARALRIVLLAWPEAHREIARRTWMVVPVHEPGTVSWSLAARPGVSFINVFGKSILDLADDLLHENSHHRLHDLQETAGFLAHGPETAEVQAFDSPWRGTRRPLHGILHGTYTFLFRAELFLRLSRLAGRPPRQVPGGQGRAVRAFVRREYRREKRMIAAALRDLEAAARSGLLTPAGRRLVGEMRAWLARLNRR
jgi:HEXXH motif-containing protein